MDLLHRLAVRLDFGLYWSDIDFESSTIDFKRALVINNPTNTAEIGELKTKNSRRIMPMPDMLRAELLKAKQAKEKAARGAGKQGGVLTVRVYDFTG
jgi:hypothetical protein